MIEVTVEILGRETEAKLRGTVWEQNEEYYVVTTGDSEYRVEESAILEDELPPVPRIDNGTDRRIAGSLQCPECRYTQEYEGRYEGWLTCGECGEQSGIDEWKATTPGHHFEYTVVEG